MSYPNSFFQHSDPNIVAAMGLGDLLVFPGPSLPNSLQSKADSIAEFVKQINVKGDFPHLAQNLNKPDEEKKIFVENLINTAKELIPDLEGTNEEILSLVFRVWAGCIAAAKGLANESNGGPVDENFRSDYFPHLDNYSNDDPLFKAGLQSAVKYREICGESNNFDGIPDDSLVRS